jgi:hypothetical protein
MLERIIRVYDEIQQVLANRRFKLQAENNITLAQLEVIKHLVKVLKPVYIVTCKMSSEKVSTLSPSEFWNGMAIAERESYITSVSKTTGEKIGISNAKCRFSTLSNKALINALVKGTGEKITGKSFTDSKTTILEETIEETVEEVTMSEELDLCISFDDTGSMYTVRSQVRSNINSLVDRLFDDIPKLRIGIIIHNDYCDMPRHIFVQDFTSDKEKIKKFVNQNCH